MRKTTGWTIIVLTFCIMILGSPFNGLAAPSAFECLENPELEGCESVDTNSDSTDESAKETEEPSEPSLVWTIVKLIFVLLLVLALIYGLLKFFNQKNKLFQRHRTMENLGGMNLAQNRSIQAVRIGEQVFILGVGDNVQMVTEVTDEKTKESLLQRDDSRDPQLLNVNGWMNKMKQSPSNDGKHSSIQFQHLFEKQLNEMKHKAKKAKGQEQEDQKHE